jgi:hypothetical protein
LEQLAIQKIDGKVDGMIRDLAKSFTESLSKKNISGMLKEERRKTEKCFRDETTKVGNKIESVGADIASFSTKLSEKVEEMNSSLNTTRSSIETKFELIKEESREMKLMLSSCMQDKNMMLTWMMGQLAQTQGRLLGAPPVPLPSLPQVCDGTRGAGPAFSTSFGVAAPYSGVRSPAPHSGTVYNIK